MESEKMETPVREETTFHEVVSRIQDGKFYEDYDWASGPALRALRAVAELVEAAEKFNRLKTCNHPSGRFPIDPRSKGTCDVCGKSISVQELAKPRSSSGWSLHRLLHEVVSNPAAAKSLEDRTNMVEQLSREIEHHMTSSKMTLDEGLVLANATFPEGQFNTLINAAHRAGFMRALRVLNLIKEETDV